IYAAVDVQLGRRVAIKLLHPHLQGDEQGRARLLREARAMARLEHEHVARIYEVGAWSDQIYIAMELIEGVTLDAWLRERARPWQAVLEVFLQAGRALAAAHHAGLLHRDFKPENVVVDSTGRARVLDFGLTCALDDRARVDDDDLAPLTRTGSILGTPAYMAPEQQRWGAAEPRSDQFSFCVALFEALFGRRPFGTLPRPGAFEIAPIPRDSPVPARIRRAIARGLAEKPEARWPTMDDLLAALQQPERPLSTSFVAGAGVGALVVGLVAFGLFRGYKAGFDAAVQRADAAEQLLAGLKAAPEAVTGRDPARLAHHLRVRDAAAAILPRDPTAAVLLLRELDDPGVLARQALAGPVAAAVFPRHDGPVLSVRWVRDAGTAEIETISASGVRRRFPARGGPARIAAAGDPFDPTRSPDGAAQLRERAGELSLETDGGQRPLRGVSGPLAAVAWTRDGSRVAAAGPRGEVWLADVADARPRTLVVRGRPVAALAWDETGARLAVGRDDGAIDVWTVDPRPRRRASFSAGVAVTGLALQSGWLASGGDDGDVRVFHLATGAPPLVLRGHRGPVRALELAPVGLITGSDDGSARVWRLAPAALAVHHLGGPVRAVAWSPDGELLAAAGDPAVGVWLLPAAGGAGERREHAETVHALAWSPDGQTLALADAAGVVTWIARTGAELRREPGERRLALRALAWDPARDVLAAGGRDEAVATWPGGQPRGELAGAAIPLRYGVIEALAWSPVDDRLAAATASGVVALLQGGKAAYRSVGHGLRDLAWSPDGAFLALAGERHALVRVAVASASLDTFFHTRAALTSVAWDPRDRLVVAGDAHGTLNLWSRDPGHPLAVLAAHAGGVLDLAFDRAGDRLASAGADGRVIVWPRLDGDLRERLALATTACLDESERQRYLGEPADVATARSEACRRGAP
ncbi:MAG TPA: protein kinase, partial [Nannocystis sp.]